MAGFCAAFGCGLHILSICCRLEAVGLRPLGLKSPGLGAKCFVVMFTCSSEQPVWSSGAPGASLGVFSCFAASVR